MKIGESNSLGIDDLICFIVKALVVSAGMSLGGTRTCVLLWRLGELTHCFLTEYFQI